MTFVWGVGLAWRPGRSSPTGGGGRRPEGVSPTEPAVGSWAQFTDAGGFNPLHPFGVPLPLRGRISGARKEKGRARGELARPLELALLESLSAGRAQQLRLGL